MSELLRPEKICIRQQQQLSERLNPIAKTWTTYLQRRSPRGASLKELVRCHDQEYQRRAATAVYYLHACLELDSSASNAIRAIEITEANVSLEHIGNHMRQPPTYQPQPQSDIKKETQHKKWRLKAAFST
uniref:Uncharacterized protein n=1 Tax=Acrobeloides nanus TaxID=290746 RepID=A0A914D3M9_9BILA